MLDECILAIVAKVPYFCNVDWFEPLGRFSFAPHTPL